MCAPYIVAYMANEQQSSQAWTDQFQLERGTYSLLAEKVSGLLLDLLKSQRIDHVQIEHRAKSISSLKDKLERKGGEYTCLKDVTDLAGVRIILYYTEDVDRVGDLIRQEFEVDENHSIQKSTELTHDQFGYLSDHYVVRLNPERTKLLEWRALVGHQVEIQIRTTTQHAWAAIEHKLRYKAPQEIPKELKRRLSRLSALFEIADEQFSSLRTATQQLEAEYENSVRNGDLDLGLDSKSLVAYTSTADTCSRFRHAIEEAGYEIRPVDDAKSRARLVRDRRDLLTALRGTGFESVAGLDREIKKILDRPKIILSEASTLTGASHLEDYLAEAILINRRAERDLIRSIYTEKYTASLIAAQASA